MGHTGGLPHSADIHAGAVAQQSNIFGNEGFLSADGMFRDKGVSQAEITNLEAVLASRFDFDIAPKSYTTYNFEVHDFHTYVADGIRVHNTSILDHVPDGSLITNVAIDNNGVASQASYIRPDGVQVTLSGQNINTDGTIVVNGTYEYNNGEAQIQYTDTYDPETGDLIDRNLEEIEFNDNQFQLENVGNIIGSQLGAFWFDDNIVESIGAGTILGTITQNLAEAIHDGHYAAVTQGTQVNGNNVNPDANNAVLSTDPLNDAIDDAFSDFGVDLVGNLRGQVIGYASSLLLAELAQELGLEGFEAGVFTSGLSSVTTTFINNTVNVISGAQVTIDNITRAATLLDNLSFGSIAKQIGDGIGGFFGSQLAHDIINVNTQEEALFSSIGSAIGSYVGQSLIPIPVLGTFIGSFVGTLIGGAIGEVFGDEPDPPLANGLIISNGKSLISTGVNVSNSGSVEYIQQLLDAHVDTYNTFLENAGILTGDFELQIGGYSEYAVDFGTSLITVSTNVSGGGLQRINDQQRTFSSAEEAIEFGLLEQITQTHIHGGDALVNIVLENTQASSLNGVLFDIQTAQDYRFYLENTEIINDIIANEPDSIIAQEWTLVLIRALSLGLTQGTGINIDNGLQTLFGIANFNQLSNDFIIDQITDDIVINDDETGVELFRLENVVGEGVISQFGTSQDDVVTLENHGSAIRIISSGLGGTITEEYDTNLNLVTYNAGGGNDYVTGDTGIDIIQGDAGNDIINGGAGGDYLSGGDGNDVITGGLGADLISGGDGNDIINVHTVIDVAYMERDSVYYELGDGFDTINITADLPSQQFFSEVDLYFGNDISLDQFFLTTQTTTIFAGTGSFTSSTLAIDISDLEGNIIGGISSQHIGNININIEIDGLNFQYTTRMEIVNLGASTTTILSENLYDDWHYGSSDSDTLYYTQYDHLTQVHENAFVDYVFAGNGNDAVFSGRGDDILLGQDGDDSLFGGLGNDTIRGGNGLDNLYAGAGDDIVEGNAGIDLLFGEEGSDILSGGADDDVIFGDINIANANDGDDILNGEGGGDNLFAGGGNDMLFGGAGSDSLFGEDGADTLSGGAALDSLVGGAGADTFIFSAGFGNDFVIDFEDNIDIINLAGLGLADVDAALAAGTAFQATNGVFFNFGNGDTLMVFGDTLTVSDLADDILV